MSVQYGRCNFDGRPVNPEDLDRVRPVLAPYGPDGEGLICKGGFAVLYRTFHTTKESHAEVQPHAMRSGAILTWDGRLDNRNELVSKLDQRPRSDLTDVEVVAAALGRWGQGSLGKLIGDWALSIWDPENRSLILAKDFLGTRHLYYTKTKDQVTWSTVLDPLLIFAGHPFQPEEEYFAGWLSHFPATNLTPYRGIHSVPACCFVQITDSTERTCKYWDFRADKRIVYSSDGEYEKHFRSVFVQSVRRRLRADAPVLAELSGGIDSASIVCVADQLLVSGTNETPGLNTISYYDDSEPNWNEKPYFAKVEQKLGRAGCHIDVHDSEQLVFETEFDTFVSLPSMGRCVTKAALQFAACMNSQRNRVLLSGIGGDEVTGGVPTPIPELADLLNSAHFMSLARAIHTWALRKRTPWLYLLLQTAFSFAPLTYIKDSEAKKPVGWLRVDFVRRCSFAFQGYKRPLRFFGALPSFQENMRTLDGLRRQLSTVQLDCGQLYEKRYPFLDRDFLEFIYAVPRLQLLRPEQRRSLMKRALVDIVPKDILERKRKAFVNQRPLRQISEEWSSLTKLTEGMLSDAMGYVDQHAFNKELRNAKEGREIDIVTMLRTLILESWLRFANSKGLLKAAVPNLGAA